MVAGAATECNSPAMDSPDPDPTISAAAGGTFFNGISPSPAAVEPDNGALAFQIPPSWSDNGLVCDAADTPEHNPPASEQSSVLARSERRHKAPKLPTERWELVKARIISLHIVRKFPLTQVKERIEREFGFTATLRQFRTQISKWNLDKNVKAREMSFIVMKRQYRKLVETDKRELVFRVRNQKVLAAKIERWMTSNKIPSDEMYIPSPVASTPDGLSYRTVSDRGSPSKSPPDSPVTASASPNAPSSSNLSGQSEVSAGTAWLVSEEARLRTKLVTIEHERGSEHAETLRTLRKLGMVLMNQGQLSLAEEFLQRLHLQSRDNHIKTAEALGDLGLLKQRRGHYQEAEAMLQRASYLLVEHGLGLEDSRTLSIRSHLARTYWHLGQWTRAESLQRGLVESITRQLGPHHPKTLQGQSSLALILITQCRWSEAERLEVEVVEARKRILGADHPNTLTSMGQLALAYHQQGDYLKARELQLELVNKRIGVLGQEHPDTVASMSQLASTYRQSGQFLEAAGLQVDVLKSRTMLLGPEHPETLNSMSELALTYLRLCRWDEAEGLQVQALESRKRVLGAEHPDTITSMSNLACSWMSWKGYGRDRDAVELIGECVQLRRRILGQNHPHTAAAQAMLDTWKNDTLC